MHKQCFGKVWVDLTQHDSKRCDWFSTQLNVSVIVAQARARNGYCAWRKGGPEVEREVGSGGHWGSTSARLFGRAKMLLRFVQFLLAKWQQKTKRNRERQREREGKCDDGMNFQFDILICITDSYCVASVYDVCDASILVTKSICSEKFQINQRNKLASPSFTVFTGRNENSRGFFPLHSRQFFD